MSIEFKQAIPGNSLPTNLEWEVDGREVQISILASDNVIIAEKVMKNFREGVKIPNLKTAQEHAVTGVMYSVCNFLYEELEMGTLREKYVFSIEQLLEL